LINNRQTGRRRGRGGGPRSPNQSPNPGNSRPENRSRGNASQLLEKYKSLARDAQLQGDRVQSEYYLQYSEHYFRVLNESRARFEEQRRQRGDYGSDEDEDQDEPAVAANDRDDERDERDDRFDRSDRSARGDGGDHGGRSESGDRNERPEGIERADRPDRGDRMRRDFREERNGERRPDRPRVRPEPGMSDGEEVEEERISLEVLPPAIAIESDVPAKAPRARRPRRPAGDDTDIAPAA
jgi:hypothetical protein